MEEQFQWQFYNGGAISVDKSILKDIQKEDIQKEDIQKEDN